MRQEFLSTQIGQTHPVLWETRDNAKKWVGYTDNYIRVEMKNIDTENLENRISNVKIVGIDEETEHCIVELD